jgi:hypothetical protein
MNTLTKAGLIFLILGGLSFLGFLFVLLQSVGGPENPPLTGWYATLIILIYFIGLFWFVFLIIGAVLIVSGLGSKKRGK